MKVSAHYADPAAASEPLPEQVRQWVEETNAGDGPGLAAVPAYHGEKELVIEIDGERPSAVRHWA